MSTSGQEMSTSVQTQASTSNSTQSPQPNQHWTWYDEEKEALVDLLLGFGEKERQILLHDDSWNEVTKKNLWASIYESFKTTKQTVRENNAVCTLGQLKSLFETLRDLSKKHSTKVRRYALGQIRRKPAELTPPQERLFSKMEDFLQSEVRPYHNPFDSSGICGHSRPEETIDPNTNRPRPPVTDVAGSVDELNETADQPSTSTTGSKSHLENLTKKDTSPPKGRYAMWLENVELQKQLLEEQLELIRLKQQTLQLKRQKLEMELNGPK